MPGMVIDLTETSANVSNFPNGVYEAKVVEAEMTIAQSSGDPMVNLRWEIHHPDLGNAVIRDNLPFNFAEKVKAFWLSANDMTEQEFQQIKSTNPSQLKDVEINPPELIGIEMLVQVGEQEGRDKVTKQPNGKIYKNIVGSWYFPASRTDLLTWDNGDEPF